MLHRAWLSRLTFIVPLIVISFSFSTPLHVFALTNSCDGSLPPRLTVGGIGRVTPGNANNMRDSASKTGKLVGKIPAGESFNVLDGPKCADGMNWWQVNYADVQGWTVEADSKDYWLLPYNSTLNVTTAGDMTHVAYDNLSFDVDSKLAKDVNADFETATWQTVDALAEHVCFYLHNDPPDESRQSNQLCAISTSGMDDAVKSLKNIITDTPTLIVPDGRTQIFTPLAGAAQLMQAKLKYINTKEIQGLSFITYYAQDDYLITGDLLQYNFSGLTRDGKYIVFLTYVSDTALLPTLNTYSDQDLTDKLSVIRENPTRYYKEIIATLNKGKASDFTPNLDTLDAIIQSIHFN